MLLTSTKNDAVSTSKRRRVLSGVVGIVIDTKSEI